jgi:hypothetical protein
MFEWLFKKVKKEEFEHHKSAVQTALNSVKHDMDHVSKWIKHLDNTDSGIKNDVGKIREEIATIREEVLEIRELLEEDKPVKIEPIFKQRQTAVVKQTAVEHVQTAVQTAVQAGFFTKLSTSERAIVGILMNTDMKLSYEDLAAMMGKDTATVRGQVNSIKQKCEGIIEEQVEKTGKKRLFVPEKVKEILLKSVKVRKKREKDEEDEGN